LLWSCGIASSCFFLVPVERFVVLFGFKATLFQGLVQVQFFIGHEVQAIAAEEPQ
jgi:hypothetical protein